MKRCPVDARMRFSPAARLRQDMQNSCLHTLAAPFLTTGRRKTLRLTCSAALCGLERTKNRGCLPQADLKCPNEADSPGSFVRYIPYERRAGRPERFLRPVRPPVPFISGSPLLLFQSENLLCIC